MQSVASDTAPLEPHHTHFVLVPGKAWGDEAPWIARVANELSYKAPSVTILINGGKIAWLDVTSSVKARRPVVVLAGSGRTADTLAAMLRSGQPVNDSTATLTTSGFLHAIDLEQGFDAIAQLLRDRLTTISSAPSKAG